MGETNKLATNEASQSAAIMPRVDVLEDKSGITLYADLAGAVRERTKNKRGNYESKSRKI